MKKNILIIGPGMEIGGVERSLLGLMDAIDYDLYDVDLFLMWHTGELMPYINKNVNILPQYEALSLVNQPIISLVKDKHYMIASIRLLCKLYGDIVSKIKNTQTINTSLCKKIISSTMKPFDKQYDYALGFFAPHFILTDKVNASVKIGWSHTDYTNIAEKPDMSFYLPMWNKLGHIACVSDSARDSFNQVFPTLEDRTITIENIISPLMINEQANESIDEDLIHDNCTIILSVGRFCAQKAFDLIPEVCSILISKGYHIRWYLIGYGQDESLIRKKIRKFSMEDVVIILGKKDNPYPYMKECDIYVQPSRYEAKAVTVTEALILHKPVMITRYNTSSSQVDEGVNGYICEQGVDGIVEGLSYMINHPELRKKLIEGTYRNKYNNANELDKIWNLL